MPSRAEESRKLTCPGCGGRFRITPRQGRRLPEAVPCPTCETRIPVERPTSGEFWVSRSYAEIFHRNPALAAPVADRQDDQLETIREQSDPESGGGVERTSRKFQDVSEVRRERESTLSFGTSEAGSDRIVEYRSGSPDVAVDETSREENASPVEEGPEFIDESEFEEVEREPASADLDEFERELSFIAADAADDVTGTPLPLPVEQPSSASIEADLPEDNAVDEGDDPAEDPPPTPEAKSGPPSMAEADKTEPMPAAELFEEFEDDIGQSSEGGEAICDVRVQDTVERDVGLRRLVHMLKEGAWPGAVEIAEGGEWVPLREHEVFDRLEEHLVGQSRQILVEGGGLQGQSAADGGRPAREDGQADSPEPAGAPEPSEAPEPVDDDESTDVSEPPEMPEASDEGSAAPTPTPESAPQRQGRVGYGWRAFAGGLLVGLTILGVLVWNRLETGGPGQSSGDGSRAALAVDGDAGAGDGAAVPEAGPTDDTAAERETGNSAPASAVDAAGAAVGEALAPGRHAEGFLGRGHYGAARRWAIRGMTEGSVGSGLQETFEAGIERDDSLVGETVTIGEDESIGAIHALGGGWSVSFRLTDDGSSAYAFKPAQKHWEEGWRAEIAAYRLCQIMACHFDIPRNRPARISKENFEKLYGEVENEDQEAYRRRFDDLMWTREAGPDGVEREYLYGTLKDWVPDFAKWPIEYEDVWRAWLGADSDPSVLERPLAEALEPLKRRGEEDFYESLLEHRGGATTRSVARQLSTVLAFDFLVSNWDRFSTAENYYGVNNQFRDGHFVSIDNGAAFPAHHFRVVARRLEPVTRFSRATTASVRALRPEVVDPVLFPDPSAKERSRLDVFWRQRDRFLDLVNGLVAEYGRSRVLYFE